MAKKRVADLPVEALVATGAQRIDGVARESLNGITDAIRWQADRQEIPVRHEATAAFAADTEAHVTGRLPMCAGSCGPGHRHLIEGRYAAHRSRVPLLAIAAHIPSFDIGSGYFQETHPEQLCRGRNRPAQ